MGFSKAKAVREIRIPMSFHVTNNDNGTETLANVVHVFKIASIPVREQHQRMLVTTKGKKVQTGSIPEANFFMWQNVILSVEGYDDIGANPGDVNYKEKLIAYFKDDDVLRLHIDEAMERYNERISAEETDVLKKFEPSSAQ